MKIETLNNSMSNIDTDEGLTEMSMDVTSVRTLMNILTEMYPDPEGAAIREYTTNATDSHIESGQKRPVEITLPTVSNPTFTVQDWGMGMGKYELEKIYGVYGKSTKRDSNDVTGAFGLGSKSALAYTAAFKLTTIKNGMLFKVLVNKNSKGSGQLRITNGDGQGEPTDLPNGVTVHIPVPLDSVESFAKKAEATYMLFKPGSILVNGVAPKTLADTGFHAVDDFAYINRSQGGSRLRIAMGGVTYRVSGMSYHNYDIAFKSNPSLRYRDIVLIADMADVNIAPSREDVLLDPKTLRFIGEGITKINDYLLTSATKEVLDAENGIEAMKVIETYRDLVKGSLFYKGVEFTETLKVPNIRNYYWTSRNKKRNSSTVGSFEIPLKSDAKKVYLFDTSKVADKFKMIEIFQRYLNTYTDKFIQHDRNGYNFMVCDVNDVKSNVFAKSMLKAGLIEVIDIEKAIQDVKDFHKANRSARVSSGARGALTYPVRIYDADGNSDMENMTLADLKAESKVYYFMANKNDSSASYFNEVAQDGDLLVEIAAGRSVEAFVKRLEDDVELESIDKIMANHFKSKLEEVSFNVNDFVAKRIAEDNYRCQYFLNAMVSENLLESLDDEMFKQVAEIQGSAAKASKTIQSNRYFIELLNKMGKPLDHETQSNFLKVSGNLTELEKSDAMKQVNDFTAKYDIIFRAYYNGGGRDKDLQRCVVMTNALHNHVGSF